MYLCRRMKLFQPAFCFAFILESSCFFSSPLFAFFSLHICYVTSYNIIFLLQAFNLISSLSLSLAHSFSPSLSVYLIPSFILYAFSLFVNGICIASWTLNNFCSKILLCIYLENYRVYFSTTLALPPIYFPYLFRLFRVHSLLFSFSHLLLS